MEHAGKSGVTGLIDGESGTRGIRVFNNHGARHGVGRQAADRHAVAVELELGTHCRARAEGQAVRSGAIECAGIGELEDAPSDGDAAGEGVVAAQGNCVRSGFDESDGTAAVLDGAVVGAALVLIF